MRFSKIQTATFYLIIANIIWGVSYPLYKWSLESIPPLTFAFLRIFLGGLILLPFCLGKIRINKTDLPVLLIFSLTGITFGIGFLFLGLLTAPSINVPIIASSAPIFLIIASFFYLKEKIKFKIVFGTILSLLGVMLLVTGPFLKNGIRGSIEGNLFLVLSTIASVVYTVLFKKLLDRYHPLTLVFWSFLLGSLFLLPFVFLELAKYHYTLHITAKSVFSVFYGAFFASAIGHTLNAFGLGAIPASEVGVFSYIDPIATILVAIPLLGEQITPLYLLASFLVFLGIFVAEERFNWHPLHKLYKNSE